MEVPPEQIRLYGCAAVEPTADGDVVRVTGLVEKPDPAEAPSNLAIIGRYVLDPAVFDVLRRTEPGRGGEIQLTDALAARWPAGREGRRPGARCRLQGPPVRHRGPRRLSACHCPDSRANVTDLGPDFRTWLRSSVCVMDVTVTPEIAGGLLTVTLIVALVVSPLLSLAVALSVCAPFDTAVLFHATVYGVAVSSAPIGVEST